MSEIEKHIPIDVMEIAQQIYASAMSHLTDTGAEVEIALAILAERERCAALCESTSMGTGYSGSKATHATHAGYIPSEATDEFHQGAGYAALIRSQPR